MKRVALIGNSGNGIFHQMVHHFLSEKSTVYLIDAKVDYSHSNLFLLSSDSFVSLSDRVAAWVLSRTLNVIDITSVALFYGLRFRFQALNRFLRLPSLKRPISNMVIHSKVVDNLPVDYVLCLNVYMYGFCSIWAKHSQIVEQPWGSDVNVYGISSPLRYYLVRKCLLNARYIAPAGRSVVGFIGDTYRVPREKLIFIHPQVDGSIFYKVDRSTKEELRSAMGLPPGSIVFFSCRRFAEGWGPLIVKELFLALSKQSPKFYFIVLSGYDENPLIEDFRKSLDPRLVDRFLFVDRKVPLFEFGRFAQVSDFVLSAMTNRDMQSSSIMQATACGAYPILLRQQEYLYMVDDGFSALLFECVGHQLIDRIMDLVDSPEELKGLIEANLKYIVKIGDQQTYVAQLNGLDFA